MERVGRMKYLLHWVEMCEYLHVVSFAQLKAPVSVYDGSCENDEKGNQFQGGDEADYQRRLIHNSYLDCELKKEC